MFWTSKEYILCPYSFITSIIYHCGIKQYSACKQNSLAAELHTINEHLDSLHAFLSTSMWFQPYTDPAKNSPSFIYFQPTGRTGTGINESWITQGVLPPEQPLHIFHCCWAWTCLSVSQVFPGDTMMTTAFATTVFPLDDSTPNHSNHTD